MARDAISSALRSQALALVAVAAIACPAIASGATRNVDAGNPACNDTTGAPFCKIQAAIDAASAGDRIEIAAGSYIESLTIDRNLTLAGAGISTVEGACDGQTNLLGGPAISVLTGITVTLTNVTVKGGTASFGGGISNAGVLFVSDSEVCENSTFNQGGGIYTTGVLTLRHVHVYSNKQASAGAEGGGLFVQSHGWAFVTNSTFDHNRTTQGGAIFVAPRGTLLIRRSILEDNFADAKVASVLSGQGAGIRNSGLAIVDETTIGAGNLVIDSHGQGGGIYNEGHLILTRSLIYANAIRPQIPEAVGPSYGAGLYNAGVAALASSTVSANLIRPVLLGYGAGIANTGTTILSNVTITENTNGGAGLSDGAGLFLNAGTATIRNSIIAKQTVGKDCSFGVTTDGHNIDSDGTCDLLSTASGGSDQPSVADPGLLPLADNGGPTRSHNLADDSPAIDGGDPAGCIADLNGLGSAKVPLATDQRGNVFVEVSGAGGDPSGCDIGAVEFNLLFNGMMEDDKNHDNLPDGWTGTNLAGADDLYCLPIWIYARRCTFGMSGDPSLVKQLAQSLDRVGNSGDRYSMKIRASASFVTGTPQLRVQFEDLQGGGITQVFIVQFPEGTYVYRPFNLDIATSAAYDHITVVIEAGSGGGLFVDDASLVQKR
jgi:predicted outer membrane repeat protein